MTVMSIGEVMVLRWNNTIVTANIHSCQAEFEVFADLIRNQVT